MWTATGEMCEIIHWLFQLIDERLHAALGRPLHAAWHQPHFTAPLSQDGSDPLGTAAAKAELSAAHDRLKRLSLFGALEPVAGLDEVPCDAGASSVDSVPLHAVLDLSDYKMHAHRGREAAPTSPSRAVCTACFSCTPTDFAVLMPEWTRSKLLRARMELVEVWSGAGRRNNYILAVVSSSKQLCYFGLGGACMKFDLQ